MPLSPTITLTITLDDLSGVDIGTVGSPAYVQVALANYGPTLPRVSGTAMLARVGPGSQRIAYEGTPITVLLFGNDVITPAGTYYVITILDDDLNILQTGAYVFTGTVTANLSTLAQFFPSPTSSVSGSEVTLQASATPSFNCGLVNGPVEFYLVLTENVTSSTLLPNIAGQIVIFRLQQDATGGHTFVWPTNVQSPPSVSSAANSVTTAAFFVASNGTAYLLEEGNGSYPASGQIGDILRWNGTAWQAVNWAQPFIGIYANNQTSTLAVIGFLPLGTTTITVLGSTASILPTATLNAGTKISASASASTSTVIGMHFGENGNVSLMGMEAFYRWSFRFAVEGITNVRYWMGLGCRNNTGAGNNPAQIQGTTAYASDTPNKSTIGFRFSAGTDTNWQAVAITAGGSQTTVDTGVAPDTSVHFFEMTTNAAGTSIFFFIDGNLVATISTNLPPPANNGDSWGDLFVVGDNKNTNTAIAVDFYSMQISPKL